MLDLGFIDIAPRKGKPSVYHAFLICLETQTAIENVERPVFILIKQAKVPGKRRIYEVSADDCTCPSPEDPCKHRREYRELRTRAILVYLERLAEEPVKTGLCWLLEKGV